MLELQLHLLPLHLHSLPLFLLQLQQLDNVTDFCEGFEAVIFACGFWILWQHGCDDVESAAIKFMVMKFK